MKASALEFRLRFWILMVIYVLGFTAPWDAVVPLDGPGPNAHVWGQLAVLLSKPGAMSIEAAFNAVLLVGILCAGSGAWLRTWASAYLGADVVRDQAMHGEGVVGDGPYRYVRNPLYLGAWVHTLALLLLMPVSGAIFTAVLLALFLMRLILGEEEFLRGKLGEAYVAYCARVPRLLPALRPQVASSGARPRWGQAALAEVFMWGMTTSFAVLGWRYNALLLTRCVLVWLGVSLLVRAASMTRRRDA
ncbi:MAG: isoprenylcysteine carboxylmethyltransferase family protein [Acidobacteriaceae bacterium]|jgi:protein-S-isoprenylcysteine O-methyltransferase Ste14